MVLAERERTPLRGVVTQSMNLNNPALDTPEKSLETRSDSGVANQDADQRAAATSSLARASTQRSPSGVSSFFQNGAWVFR